jgi:hypothetical protein
MSGSRSVTKAWGSSESPRRVGQLLCHAPSDVTTSGSVIDHTQRVFVGLMGIDRCVPMGVCGGLRCARARGAQVEYGCQ